MNFEYPPEAERFRAEFRSWLAANLDPEVVGATLSDWERPEVLERMRAWNRSLADAGYAALA